MPHRFSSQRLRSAREGTDLSRQVSASWAGISTSALQSYEAGERVPRVDVISKLAELYGVEVDFFWAADAHDAENRKGNSEDPHSTPVQSVR